MGFPVWWAAVALLSAPQPSAPTPHPSDSLVAAKMHEHDVPGMAFVVVRDGAIVQLRGFGVADARTGRPVDPERTVFRIASVSKLFVATAVSQLVERGTLDLHADVNRYLRAFQLPATYAEPVTLEHLLTHTAGFDERVIGYAARDAASVQPLAEHLATRMPPRTMAPGRLTSYSNYGVALAAYVVESVTGEPFAAVVESSILTPLGMVRSTYSQPPADSLVPLLATGHRCEAGRCTALHPDYRHAYPPGGMLSTAADMSRFMLAHLEGGLQGGARVISDSARTLLQQRHFTHDTRLPGMALGFFEQETHGHRALSHAGGSPGFASVLLLVPDARLGVFVAINGGNSRFGGELLQLLLDAYFPTGQAPDAPGHPAPTLATMRREPASGGDVAGVYRLTRYARRSVENLPALFLGPAYVSAAVDGEIDVTGVGPGTRRFREVDSLLYREVSGDGLVAFRRDERGHITHLFGPQSFMGAEFPGAYERLAWYDTPHFVNELLSYTAMIPPIVLLFAWPVAAGIRRLVMRRRRRSGAATATDHAPQNPRVRRTAALGIAAAATFATLYFLFCFRFIAASVRMAARGGGELVYGMPPSLAALTWIPAAIVVLAVALVACTIWAVRRRVWSRLGRFFLASIAVDACIVAAILVRWGYLPLRY